MRALFIHGMGRSPLSGWPMLRRLRRGGLQTSTFAYAVTVEDFASIRNRLAKRIQTIADLGEYVLIGHSLGGVLVRAALNSMADGANLPRHVFLLGSPIQSPRIARHLRGNP
jgi:surfactin synthase thioesterase subunit